MVKIRLCRIGRSGLPFYRIVVSDSRRTPHSANLADLGSYDPKTGKYSLDEEAALKWLNNGAIPSDSVKTLLTKKGVIKKYAEAKVAARKGLDSKKTKAKKNPDKHKKAKTAAKKAAKAEAAKKAAAAAAAKPAAAPKAEEKPVEAAPATPEVK
jgi:small subunit ribosomal protein S16